MRRCATGRNRIRGLMPAEAMVEHKTGTLNGYTGDVGYLTRPDGRPENPVGSHEVRRRKPSIGDNPSPTAAGVSTGIRATPGHRGPTGQ